MSKCQYHNEDITTRACSECGEGLCKECLEILDDLEQHNYMNSVMSEISKNTCMKHTLFNLSCYKSYVDNDKEEMVMQHMA